MTSEEKALEQIRMQKRNGEDCEIEYDVLEFLEITVEENTKLKAEIEQLKAEKILDTTQLKEGLISLQEYKILCLEEEIEKLKAELEQSVKLPCKVGGIVYVVYNVKGREPVILENKFTLKYYADNVNYFGKTIFLTLAEAEQSLKDKMKE